MLLADADLDLSAGSVTAVTGASGVGKTTLLHVLIGRRPATAGTLLLYGTPLPAATGQRGRDHLRAVQLAGQSAVDELNPAHRVDRAVARPLSVLHGLGRAAALAEARALLAAVGLPPGSAARRPHLLSGGQRQRVVLARALAARPDVLLLDEPTASLDSGTARSVLDLLDRVRETGTAILTVTHDPAMAARADTVLALRDRRLLPVPRPDLSTALHRTEPPRVR
ncbi:ATP-binding cassette domain-containing protein [Streptomyces acidiscabies]|uniref:ATP-binding cassette domain-containing protein n=1 Tax=Streptomyces acidiscabies TaxID=42234 RepID=UPI0038F7B0F6